MNELLKQLQRHYDENQKEFYEKDYYDNDLVYSIDCDEIKLIIDNFNNLQSKIDKANEILDKLEMQPVYLDCKYYELDGFNELRNTLKEDK